MKPELDQKLAALLLEAQEGNLDAYESFLKEISGLLRDFLSKRMQGAESIEDVLQESLLAVHRARHSYIPGRALGPWLYTISENRMIDFFRRHRKIQRIENALLQIPKPPLVKLENFRGERVLAAVQKLPPLQRKIIELLKLSDMSVKEVATLLKMTESAVKVTAFRGYSVIRKLFGNEQSEN